MKMIMHYAKNWGPYAAVVGHETDPDHRYNLYIGCMLSTELGRVEDCQAFLTAMDDVQRKGGDAEARFCDKGWGMDIRPTTVTIWSTTEDEWVDVFPFEQVRRIVQAWMKLLQMPDSPESQIIVDLDGVE